MAATRPPPPHDALPWDWDLNDIYHDDCITALKNKMQDMDVNVNDMFYHHGDKTCQTVRLTLLSAAVEMGALESVTYLKTIEADSHQIVDNWGTDWAFDMSKALRQDEWVDNDWLGTPEYEVAKEMWTEFASNKYNMSREVCRDLIEVEGHNWIELRRAQDGEPYVRVHSRSLGIGDGYDIGRIRIWTEEDSEYTAAIFQGSSFNSNQRAIILHGRDSLIARVVRGESDAIAAGYKEGFEAFCYCADMRRVKQKRHCSLQLAKKDGRLWYLLMGLAKFGIPEELREHIVRLAFFGNGPKTGKGKRVYPRQLYSQVYEGEFKDGEPHGHGKMVVVGDEGEYQCEGEYEEGFPHGQATVMFPNGDVYQGELGSKDIGKGTYTVYNGEVYMGYYETIWYTGNCPYIVSHIGQGVQWSSDRTQAWAVDGEDSIYEYEKKTAISLQAAADFAASLNLSVP